VLIAATSKTHNATKIVENKTGQMLYGKCTLGPSEYTGANMKFKPEIAESARTGAYPCGR
jgi:hypothetical protein